MTDRHALAETRLPNGTIINVTLTVSELRLIDLALDAHLASSREQFDQDATTALSYVGVHDAVKMVQRRIDQTVAAKSRAVAKAS